MLAPTFASKPCIPNLQSKIHKLDLPRVEELGW